MILPLVLIVAAVAKPPEAPAIDEIAQSHGYEAALEALLGLEATYPKAKNLARALQSCGLERVSMPVQLRLGAELVLSDATPVHGCTWDGEHLSCEVRASATAEARAEDYQVSCRTSFGAVLPLEAEALATPAGLLGWSLHSVERCWEIGAADVQVQPVSHGDLEGIGQGTELIPPELVELSWQEAEAVIMDHLSQFKYCYQRDKDGPAGVGALKVRYRIAEDGTVAEATVEEATFDNQEVTACILSRFERLRFPPPMGGWTGGTFPFTFQR